MHRVAVAVAAALVGSALQSAALPATSAEHEDRARYATATTPTSCATAVQITGSLSLRSDCSCAGCSHSSPGTLNL